MDMDSKGSAKALMNSCNDALMQMSYAIGVDNFVEYQKIFGFGQKTNIDLPGRGENRFFDLYQGFHDGSGSCDQLIRSEL